MLRRLQKKGGSETKNQAKPCPPHDVVGSRLDVEDSREFSKQAYYQRILQNAVCKQFRSIVAKQGTQVQQNRKEGDVR